MSSRQSAEPRLTTGSIRSKCRSTGLCEVYDPDGKRVGDATGSTAAEAMALGWLRVWATCAPIDAHVDHGIADLAQREICHATGSPSRRRLASPGHRRRHRAAARPGPGPAVSAARRAGPDPIHRSQSIPPVARPDPARPHRASRRASSNPGRFPVTRVTLLSSFTISINLFIRRVFPENARRQPIVWSQENIPGTTEGQQAATK